MNARAGMALVDVLLLVLLAYRMYKLRRRLREFRPKRDFKSTTVPRTILTRVS